MPITTDEFKSFLCDIGVRVAARKPEKARVIAIHKVKWKMERPESFPCFMCRERYGEWMVKMERDLVTVNLVLCDGCVDLPSGEIAEHFLGRG